MSERPIDDMMMAFRESSDPKERLELRTKIKGAVINAINAYRESPPDPSNLGDWQSAGACRQFPEVMFQEQGERWAGELARRACSVCVVKAECVDYALSDEKAAPFGVWGNMSERERRAHFKRKKAA